MLKDQIPQEVADFIANCENADLLRYINQRVLMPKMRDIWAKRLSLYAGNIQWGDVIFAPWGDGKSYAGMIWEVIDEHTVKAFFFDEGTIDKPKLHSIEVKTISAVAYMAEIDASAMSEGEWKDQATTAIMEARDIILDSDPVFPENFDEFLNGLYQTANGGE